MVSILFFFEHLLTFIFIADLIEGIKPLIDYQPLISFDFYKEISIFELRLLYLRTNKELETLDLQLSTEAHCPNAFVTMKSYMLLRKAAIEIEI